VILASAKDVYRGINSKPFMKPQCPAMKWALNAQMYQPQAMKPGSTLGRRPTGMSCNQLWASCEERKEKRREKSLSGLSGMGCKCQVSNGIIHTWVPIYFGSPFGT
jgi:hypothetical protein